MVVNHVRRWSRRQRSSCRFGGYLVLVFALSILLYTAIWQSSSKAVHLSTTSTSPRPSNPSVPQQASFWRQLYSLILYNDPRCEYPPELVAPHKLDIGFDPSLDRPRPDVLWMRPADVKRMRVAHTTFLNDLAKDAPALVFEPGSRGIATTAGIRQLPVLVISLRMLRRTECNIPVEVFLASESDYDAQVCELILPALDAKCVLLSDIFRASGTGVALEGYQYKFMSLLFSSFDEVLLLDSDAFPTKDPSFLFDQPPFSELGMVLWPDFWYPSESPYFFELAQLGPPPPLQARPAIESGEMMFSKQKHNLTILLAAYYNYHGPQYFYRLFSQGGPGQGDKDTFGWAATITNSNTSFHLVHDPVFALGHTDSSGTFVGSAMAQHDPTRDYTSPNPLDNSPSPPNIGKPNAHPQQNTSLPTPPHGNATHTPTPLFVHANFPKFDPATIFNHGESNTARPIFDSNNTAVRAWLPARQAIEYFGYDVERAFWAEIQFVACDWEGMFRAWEGRRDICYNVKMYRGRVFT